MPTLSPPCALRSPPLLPQLGCWALVWAWCWVLALALGLACWAGLGCGINRYLSTLNPHPLVHCALACATINGYLKPLELCWRGSRNFQHSNNFQGVI